MDSTEPFSVPTLVVEDRTVVRQGLVSLLANTRYHVLGAWADVDQIPPYHDADSVSLILAGVSSPHRAICRLAKVRLKFPQVTVCAVSEDSDSCTAHDIVRQGADACISNIRSKDVLLKALDLTMLRQHLLISQRPRDKDRSKQEFAVNDTDLLRLKFLPPSEPHTETFDLSTMSQRELEILSHLATGASNKTIARSCGISEATVKVHLKTILKKIRVHNRTQAAIVAVQAGLAFPVVPQLTSDLS